MFFSHLKLSLFWWALSLGFATDMAGRFGGLGQEEGTEVGMGFVEVVA
jgi:hypothetical protein